MPGEEGGIIARRGRARFDDQCYGLRTKAMRGQSTVRGQPAKERPAADRRGLKPGAVMADRFHAAAVEDGD